MAENKQTIAVSPSALIFLGVVILGLVGSVGYLYGKVGTSEKGTTAIPTTAATQGTTAQQVVPTGAPLDIATIKGIFDKNVVKFGDKNRKLLVVEVTDPSCPYCHVANGDDPEIAAQMGAQFKYVSQGGAYQPPLPEIRKLVDSGQASYAFVYFPGHTAGELAAKALYCAFDQGKFWQAHDLLYSFKGYNLLNNTVHNDKANSGILADFLKGAVDATALKSCLDSGKYDSRTTDEASLAQSTLFDPQGGGTPTFILNATRFPGAYNWTDMKSTAEAAVK
jgi:protein-disulfide isomerase